jgi:hypothetical protein
MLNEIDPGYRGPIKPPVALRGPIILREIVRI